MRTFTTEHTVYSFEELSDEAKKVALDKQREWVWQYGLTDLNDAMREHLIHELLPKYKMKCAQPNVHYSLSYSQGDGAMFEGEVEWKSWRVEVRQNGMYYHYNSKQFWNFQSIKTGREPRDDKSELAFNEAYTALCRELEKYGYDYIEQELEDATLIENINANEYEFYADGSIA